MVAKLVPLIPEHKQYVEPFFGGGSLFFAKEPAEVETINDIDSGVVNFFRVLRDPEKAKVLIEKAKLTPYSREEFYHFRDTWQDCEDPVEKAYRWFVVAKWSFSGRFGQSLSTKVTTSSRGMAGTTSSWLSTVEMLPEVVERLRRVQIENQDFRVLMKRYCTPNSFCYCDPPYILETRRGTTYAHEMTDDDHRDLVELLLTLPGKFMLSGYRHKIYKPLEEAGWKRLDFETVCHAAGRTRSTGILGKGAALRMQKRVESVWLDPKTADEKAVQIIIRPRIGGRNQDG